LKPHQVHELLQLLGMKTRLDEVRQMIFEIDTDNSGTVDFDEFLQVGTCRHEAADYTSSVNTPVAGHVSISTSTHSNQLLRSIPQNRHLYQFRLDVVATQFTTCLLLLPQVASKPQQLPYSRADLLRSFRMFADKHAPPGSISPEALEAALVSPVHTPQSRH
jgi:hypothetical protein